MSIRKTAACFFAAIWMLFLGIAAADQTPLIQDDAELLTAEEESRLYQDMEPLCAYGTPMFWTSNEPGNERTLAEGFYQRHLGNGQSGILFVINMKERFLTIVSAGEIYRTVTRSEADTITDNVYRMAGRGEYYACASSVFSQALKLLEGEKIARPMKLVSNIMLAAALALLAIYLYLRFRYENRAAGNGKKALLPVTAATAAAFAVQTSNVSAKMTKQKKINISSSSSGGGGHSGGGGGGHSGGGGFSGGGGSHRF